MNTAYICISIFLMAGVTYLIRMLPMTLFRQEIKNPFVKSFLYYVPYACLAAMTFPAILTSTQYLPAAAIGFLAAVIAAYFEKSLVSVAAVACVVVFIAERVLDFL